VHRLDSLLALYQAYVAPNPPNGIIVDYHLRGTPPDDITIDLIGEDGAIIQQYSSHVLPAPAPRPAGALAYKLSGGARLRAPIRGEEEPGLRWGALTPKSESSSVVPRQPGINRFVVPIVAAVAHITPGLLGSVTPAALVPGTYTIRLTIGNDSYESPVRVERDPRVATSQKEFQAQFEFLIRIRDRVNDIHRMIARLRDLRTQLLDRRERALRMGKSELFTQTQRLIDMLEAIENGLIQPGLNENSGELDGTHFPDRVDGKLQALSYQVARSDNAPTRQALELWEVLDAEVATQEMLFAKVTVQHLPDFNRLCRDQDFAVLM